MMNWFLTDKICSRVFHMDLVSKISCEIHLTRINRWNLRGNVWPLLQIGLFTRIITGPSHVLWKRLRAHNQSGLPSTCLTCLQTARSLLWRICRWPLSFGLLHILLCRGFLYNLNISAFVFCNDDVCVVVKKTFFDRRYFFLQIFTFV